jgi:sulfate adenylyltransferase subunit 1
MLAACGGLDLAPDTNGLKAECEQGIKIDLTWRYFATAKQASILADCPGQEQCPRNMAIGASRCQFETRLIDARNGLPSRSAGTRSSRGYSASGTW